MKRIMYRPSAPKSVTQSGFRHVVGLGGIAENHHSAWRFNHDIGALITSLFGRGGPFAIFRRIASVIIYSVKRTAFRLFSHIGEKIFKLRPSVTNRNAASTIASKASSVGAATSGVHRQPHIIRCSSVHPMDAPRLSIARSRLSMKATAATESSLFVWPKNLFSTYNLHGAAIASDSPINTIFGDDGKSSKSNIIHGGYYRPVGCKDQRNLDEGIKHGSN